MTTEPHPEHPPVRILLRRPDGQGDILPPDEIDEQAAEAARVWVNEILDARRAAEQPADDELLPEAAS